MQPMESIVTLKIDEDYDILKSSRHFPLKAHSHNVHLTRKGVAEGCGA